MTLQQLGGPFGVKVIKHRKAVDTRHDEIEHDRVELTRGERLQRLFSVLSPLRRIPELIEHAHRRACRGAIILDEHYRLAARLLRLPWTRMSSRRLLPLPYQPVNRVQE